MVNSEYECDNQVKQNKKDMTQQAKPIIHCPYCDTGLPAGTTTCPACGSPQTEITLSPDYQSNTLDGFIEKSHQSLIDSGTRAAEIAFGVSSTLGILVSGILMVIIFLAITKTWTILAVSLFIIILISILISSLLSSRAKDATTRATYKRDIKPGIDHFFKSNDQSYEEVTKKAGDLLPEDSPLLVYLSNKEST
jgi:hypothetical protein